METRRYTFKVYPNAGQNSALHNQRRLCGDVWNAAIQQREESYRRQSKSLSFFDQSKEVKTLRSECPEFRAVSASSLALALKSVDLAYKAFFRRLKEGKSYSEAGHPRFRHPDRHPSIPLRDGGYKMEMQGRFWRVRMFGVDGSLKTRGKFPIDPENKDQFRSAELLWRDGKWWLSVVVRIPARRSVGADKVTVRLDLIDEFARVERENGAMSAPRGWIDQGLVGLEAQTSQGFQVDASGSVAETLELRGDDRASRRASSSSWVAEPLESRGNDRYGSTASTGRGVAEAPESRGDDRLDESRRRPLGVAEALESGVADLLDRVSITRMKSDLLSATLLEKRADQLKAERDTRFKRGSIRWKEWTRRARAKTGKAARIRREALHKWSSDLVESAADLTVIRPDVRSVTKTGRGNEKAHGAKVAVVAEVNRHVLGQAPALAVQMIEYKASEAGVRCDVITDEAPKANAGQDLSKAAREAKKARRQTKKREMSSRVLEAAE